MSQFDLYREIFASIRQTDDISFKILAVIPALSGAGVFTLLIQSDNLDLSVVVPLSIIGFILTLNLARWELRNVNACEQLRNAAIKLEFEFPGDFPRVLTEIRDNKPRLLGLEASKTKAETSIYFLSLVAWLVPVSWIGLQLISEPLGITPEISMMVFGAGILVGIVIATIFQIAKRKMRPAPKKTPIHQRSD